MAADTTQRKAKYPRGLIFNTAEEVPRGESLVARLFVVECQTKSVNFSLLSHLQQMAEREIFATAMSGFIHWLAKNYSSTIAATPKAIALKRDEWANRQISNHRRYATTLGHLSHSWSIWIQAAESAGALTSSEARTLMDRVNIALASVGRKQDGHSNTQNPVIRFCELLSSAFASGKAHLARTTGEAPLEPQSWGWRKVGNEYQPGGDRIGWHTGEEIYLLPDAAYSMLERFAASGEGVGVQQDTLWKHLHDAGLVQKDEKRRTIRTRKRVQGSSVNVLVFCARKLSTYADNADNADNSPD